MKKLFVFVLVLFISGCGSTELDGSSYKTWGQSYIKMVEEIDKEDGGGSARHEFNVALNQIIWLSLAKTDPNFKKSYQVTSTLNLPETGSFQYSLLGNHPDAEREFLKQTNGMSFTDVIKAGDDAHEELMELLAEREK